MKEKKFMKEKNIPIFFATDDNYVPCLAVALQSMLANADKTCFYEIHILHSYLSDVNRRNLAAYANDYSSIEFLDVSAKLDELGSLLHLRDYYTKTTYFRLFIPSLCPQYEKALYLDGDIVVLGDISKLYNQNLGDNLVGAINEDVMINVKVFGDYVEEALGISRFKYFNAGILLMNLAQFRTQKIEEKFVKLISEFTFKVTQDEDYLNVLCKNRVLWINYGWNRAPIPNTKIPQSSLQLIHYKMAWKPWLYNDVMYNDIFWEYAAKTRYNEILKNIRDTRTPLDVERDKKSYDNLVSLALKDISDPNNYHRTTSSNSLENDALQFAGVLN